MFPAALFTIAKMWKQPKHQQMSMCTDEHYSAMKKEVLTLVTRRTEFEDIMLSEARQRETNTA